MVLCVHAGDFPVVEYPPPSAPYYYPGQAASATVPVTAGSESRLPDYTDLEASVC